MNIRQQKLPIETLERIDDLCAEFERQWQSAGSENRPKIEAMLAQSDSAESPDSLASLERSVLLAELILLDVDYRRRRGETPALQEYLDRFPQDSETINNALSDEFQENGKRARAFEPPTVERLAELFPSLEIIELVGAGGMGAVYKARQAGLDRLVALKILPEELGHDVKFALRFTREARTLAKLTHPNIVSVHEFGNVADTYYFLMEFVEGSTLRDVVAAGQIAPEHALVIVPHLCDALQYAHDKGIIHRDIKPENILVSIDGSVKIADFGLSRILGNESPQEMLTGTHQVMGTPRYMAPESLAGSRHVDHRADIYSLGVVFYEMLTGELPIGRFAAPSKKVKIDVRLDEVVLRTLEKEPQLRYQHASQIKSDVQSITSTNQADFALTAVNNSQRGVASTNPDITQTSDTSLAQQELAGRLLLTRRQLLERVKRTLRPLYFGQWIQIFVGIALILLAVQSYVRGWQFSHRVICGIIVHVYGVAVISQSALVFTRLRKIDYSKPIDEIREKLDSLGAACMRAGIVIGFAWWLMWIPLAVAIGFDFVLYPPSLTVSLIIGVVGFAACVLPFWLILRRGNPSAEMWRKKLAGNSIHAAHVALDEIEKAQIR